jgi:hypothetical protein
MRLRTVSEAWVPPDLNVAPPRPTQKPRVDSVRTGNFKGSRIYSGSPSLSWLRGSDLNRRPLGFEPFVPAERILTEPDLVGQLPVSNRLISSSLATRSKSPVLSIRISGASFKRRQRAFISTTCYRILGQETQVALPSLLGHFLAITIALHRSAPYFQSRKRTS